LLLTAAWPDPELSARTFTRSWRGGNNVPLEMAFHELSVQLRKLRDTFLGVRLTVVEDKPPRDEVALVDRFGDAVEDIVGWLEEALAAAVEGEQAVGNPPDMYRTRSALTACQARFNRLAQQFAYDLISYERIDDLTKFGRKRGGEWRRWASTVRESLEQCRQPLQETGQALFMCWQELADRLGMSSVAVQNTVIGQQIAAPELAGRETAHGGIT
jgi:hypothetical protein